MKTNILNLFTIVAIGIAIVGFKNKTEEAAASHTESSKSFKADIVKYTANVEESTINWQGFKPTGSHIGTINLISGVFTTNDGKIDGGSFVFDMSSIKESKDNARLEGHLKSSDFFDVVKFPSARFEITSLEEKDGNTLLSGNLILKDITNSVVFPVSITHKDDTLTLSSEVFTIDRSKWNVRYGSKSFFDDLKDKFINDDIELKITIKAKKSI